ncbi:hypothetical protein SHIRM173S_04733 [Streptomyces hirsutus]
MAEFTMELNEEQREVREWLHGFAADVIRPAAAEWDEREETPWPVIQEAAKVGIYSLDFYAQQYSAPGLDRTAAEAVQDGLERALLDESLARGYGHLLQSYEALFWRTLLRPV